MTPAARPGAASRLPDEALMERYADGDSQAFDELFRRYEARAYAFFVARTRSPERARDLYQELFLRIHRARASYDGSRPFTPWLFQIARHLLVDDVRRAHRFREVPFEEHERRADRPGSDVRLSDREQVAGVLGALSPEERYVLVSSKVEGMGYPEIAIQLGKSVDAVKKLASRALQRLRAAQPAPATSVLPAR
jgi:RNA polymerase sigma-70 factor (ECF subfamily)